MKIVVTGDSKGIGRQIVNKFWASGHTVIGIDIYGGQIGTHITPTDSYTKYFADVGVYDELPDIKDVDILINNAGVQNSEHDIQTNLQGVINCTKKYGLQPNIKSIINMASVSAHNGAEFGEYVASKGGVLAYTKWTAKEVAKYGATCNSLSFGGVETELNDQVLSDKTKWSQIMEQTPLKRWMSPGECAEWAYFLSVINKSCTAQDIIIDNGEMHNHKFIW